MQPTSERRRPKSLKAAWDGCENRIEDVRCLIDTGATVCAIRSSLAGRLGLQEFNVKEIVNSTGKEWCPIYLVELITGDGEWRGEYEVAGCAFGGQELEFVLGRNFLEHAEFTYNGPLGNYELKFSTRGPDEQVPDRAPPRGLEPPTSALAWRCSIRLSYDGAPWASRGRFDSTNRRSFFLGLSTHTSPDNRGCVQ